ncbi:helix-turn-helix domain-containing protein [Actinacidiphila glaucinigra]|uniref:helix-turn-helix domain-containing protein n=1 Tax=Actinacidiphila glaucinigra TaxID=235986 RepID=UPI00379FB978
MPEETHPDIGARIKEVRKRRGFTQRELAEASGVSLSLIRKLEQGEKTDTRMETARRLAVALHVPTTALLVHHGEDAADAATLDHWDGVRRALLAPTLTGPDEPPTLRGMREAIEAAVPLFANDKFAELTAVLPGLLRDANALVDVTAEGRRVRGRLMQLAGWLMTQTRQFEAADIALARAMDDAADRLDGAATASTECWLLMRRGRVGEARELAIRWADEAEPMRMSRATPDELSAWGWMLLRVSAASIRDARPGEAESALRLARSAAVATGREWAPGGDFLRAFGPVTVALKAAENAMVSDRPDLVLRQAERIPKKGLRPTSNNWNRHRLDVAQAYVSQRQYADAVGVLQEVRGNAPQWFPSQRYARDILGQVIAKRRTLTPDMRELADAVGLPM